MLSSDDVTIGGDAVVASLESLDVSMGKNPGGLMSGPFKVAISSVSAVPVVLAWVCTATKSAGSRDGGLKPYPFAMHRLVLGLG